MCIRDSAYGADHCSATHDGALDLANFESQAGRDNSYGINVYDGCENWDVMDVTKAHAVKEYNAAATLRDMLGTCSMGWGWTSGVLNVFDMQKVIEMVTGWKMTQYEMMMCGYRAVSYTHLHPRFHGGSALRPHRFPGDGYRRGHNRPSGLYAQ